MATGTTGNQGRELPIQAMHFMRKAFAYDTTGIATAATVEVGVLPAGAVIFALQVVITTAFAGGTSPVFNVGTSANPDAYADSDASDVDVTAAGNTIVWRGGDETIITADTEVYVVYSVTGTDTAGAGEIILMYTTDTDG